MAAASASRRASPVLLAVSMPIERSAPMTRYPSRTAMRLRSPVPQARSRSTEPSGSRGRPPWPCASPGRGERHDAVHEVIARGDGVRTSSAPLRSWSVPWAVALRWSSAGSIGPARDTRPTDRAAWPTPGFGACAAGPVSSVAPRSPLLCGSWCNLPGQITQRDRQAEHTAGLSGTRSSRRSGSVGGAATASKMAANTRLRMPEKLAEGGRTRAAAVRGRGRRSPPPPSRPNAARWRMK